MIDQEMNLPLAKRLNLIARPVDIGQTIAVVTAITRREWMSQGSASPALDGSSANRSRFALPLFKLSLDPKRGSF
jgi:hypothetical protein